MQELRRFFADESGPELVEWVVVTLILLIFTIATMMAIGGRLKDMFVAILTELQTIPLTEQ